MSRLVFWHLTLIFDHVTLNRNHLLSRTNQCTKWSKFQAKYSLNIEQAIQMSDVQQYDSDFHLIPAKLYMHQIILKMYKVKAWVPVKVFIHILIPHVCINPPYISITKREMHILIYPCSKQCKYTTERR